MRIKISDRGHQVGANQIAVTGRRRTRIRSRTGEGAGQHIQGFARTVVKDWLDRPSFGKPRRTASPDLRKRQYPCTGQRDVVCQVGVRNGFELIVVKVGNTVVAGAETRSVIFRLAIRPRELIADASYAANVPGFSADAKLQRVVVRYADICKSIQIVERSCRITGRRIENSRRRPRDKRIAVVYTGQFV